LTGSSREEGEVLTSYNATTRLGVEEDGDRRRLQGGKGGGGGKRQWADGKYLDGATNAGIRAARRNEKRFQAKNERLKKLLRAIESPFPDFLKPEPWGKTHNPAGPVIFAAAMAVESRRLDANMFCGTARKGGFDGDFVIAVLPGSDQGFLDTLKENHAVVYTVAPECTGDSHNKVCGLKGMSQKFSINMIRFYLYQWWASKYNEDALIMLSDFRDVFFQGNPFTYRTYEWAPPVSQLVVFQEAYPNKVIYRCVFNGGWIQNCYGDEGIKRVGSNTVSCSGVSIGTRDAIIAYAHLMTQQLDPRVRFGRNTTMTNKMCISLGMDQGFHNWLVYSGQLDKYLDVKIFQQGEGPVNTVGAFFPGERALLKMDLKTWKVLRGEKPEKTFHNWNGDLSPVVHQADRFLNSDLNGGYAANLKVASKFK